MISALCTANWCTNFNCSLGLGFGDGLGLWLILGCRAARLLSLRFPPIVARQILGHLLLSGDGLGLEFWVMDLE